VVVSKHSPRPGLKAGALLSSLFLLTGCLHFGPDRSVAETGRNETVVASVRAAAQPLTGSSHDYDALLELIGDSRFVLLGEQTHGTHEFYRERARITRRLIEEKGFTAMAIEGDSTDAARVDRYVSGLSRDARAEQALAAYKGFPAWMWNNADVRDLVTWMRQYNESAPAERRAGFYGLDLYGLWDASEAAVKTLERLDPAAAARARQRYRCFEGFRKDGQIYARTTAAHPNRSCQRQATEELGELQAWWDAGTVPREQREELFSAVQNARVVKNGEAYYRALARAGRVSWNLRDRHMADSLDALAAHLEAQGKPAKIVVWAHNTHLGDARVTQMHKSGELNLGQLVRQRHGDDAVLVGFSTYQGTVTAAGAWGDRGRTERLRPSLPGSESALFHEAGIGDFFLPLRGGEHAEALAEPRLQRAVGVVYKPLEERRMHYFEAQLAQQFDAVVHIDETEAVKPLAR
jgi:erythromycin esterase-like protein